MYNPEPRTAPTFILAPFLDLDLVVAMSASFSLSVVEESYENDQLYGL
jgi:hypothetical protein